MRFKVDENLPVEVAALFRDAATCLAEDRVLIILDTDFANILRHPPGHTAGVTVLRLAKQEKPQVLAVVSTSIPLLEHEALRGRRTSGTSSVVVGTTTTNTTTNEATRTAPVTGSR